MQVSFKNEKFTAARANMHLQFYLKKMYARIKKKYIQNRMVYSTPKTKSLRIDTNVTRTA